MISIMFEITPGNLNKKLQFPVLSLTLNDFLASEAVRAEVNARLKGDTYDILVDGRKKTPSTDGGMLLTDWTQVIFSKSVKGA
jgi:hypothetical protein